MSQVLLKKVKTHKGITLIEVAIGVSLLSITVIMTMFIMSLFIDFRKEAQEKTKALYLAEEGLEILRFIRDDDWTALADDLSVDTTYYLDVTAASVSTTNTPEVIDSQYRREFELRDVYRHNTSDDIVSSTSPSSSVDDGSLEVVMRVGYGSGTTTLRAILANVFDV